MAFGFYSKKCVFHFIVLGMSKDVNLQLTKSMVKLNPATEGKDDTVSNTESHTLLNHEDTSMSQLKSDAISRRNESIGNSIGIASTEHANKNQPSFDTDDEKLVEQLNYCKPGIMN